MNPSVELGISFHSSGQEIEMLKVTPIDDQRYRIEENPLFTEMVSFGDIIKLEQQGNIYFYKETVRKSRLRRYSWLLSQDVASSEELAAFKNRVADSGGNWETIFGGMLIINVPSHIDFDPDVEINNITVSKDR
ncbi:protein of unknown function [Paenibacillus algorifonticola]|uniref:Uncharacterized protein n=1 Tax=Paenibacillus algorifonticola TaxID=684063 RepID=A0A1I2B6U7_9BACL|nr:DUF4265 domain-containing protein [Paenibacillus algorifonticola]SFE51912.1 protein of unknown function [Paenibacillus algorifonticola]